jgi:HEAT repeat protein
VIADVLLPFIAGSVALLAVLVLLVVGRKLGRSHAERRSRARLSRYEAALRAGSREPLVRMAREARRPPAADDLVQALAHVGAALPRERWAALVDAAEAAGLAPRLRAALGASRPVTRGRAAILVAGLRLPDPVGALEPLLADPDVDVRHAALGGLTRDGSPEAARALVRTLDTGTLPVERVVERLGRPWAAPVLLEAWDVPAVLPLRGWIAEALGLAGEARALPVLERLLRTGNDDERVRACRAVGRIGGPGALAALLPVLDDPYAPARAQAARALGELGDPEATTALGEGLSDPDWWVRANAGEALRRLGEPGLDVLRAALWGPDRYARDRAAEALCLEATAR